MDPRLEQRAAVHAALAEPHRLAIVDELADSDRSPGDLSRQLGIASNLLAHHLEVLEATGLIDRVESTGDRRRRYVRVRHDALAGLQPTGASGPRSALFVCSHNSARSQLAAALWSRRAGSRATSAGTHPATRVHPRAVAAADRAGLDLHDATPALLTTETTADLVVTVCDRAHEELAPPPSWLHWSIPDPVETDTDEAFDAVISQLESRIQHLT